MFTEHFLNVPPYFFFGRCKKEKEEMDGVPNMMFNSKQTNKLKTAIY
jgi:hypothetical protein